MSLKLRDKLISSDPRCATWSNRQHNWPHLLPTGAPVRQDSESVCRRKLHTRHGAPCSVEAMSGRGGTTMVESSHDRTETYRDVLAACQCSGFAELAHRQFTSRCSPGRVAPAAGERRDVACSETRREGCNGGISSIQDSRQTRWSASRRPRRPLQKPEKQTLMEAPPSAGSEPGRLGQVEPGTSA